ncbi:MAG: hypothetical protein QW717_03095 [Candidatus Bathyarchaeia archaeon]
MQTLLDDIGSFPLPHFVERETFEKAYEQARMWAAEGRDFMDNEFLFKNFHRVIISSFKMKFESGLDIVNYPQHYDICRQFTDEIRKAMEKGTYIVDEKYAVIPEVYSISREAKKLCEEFGKEKIALRVCVTGPMELYLKMVGTTVYKDVLLMFAETTRRYAKNSLLNSKYVKTEVVSIDEPSFGFCDVSAEKEAVIDVLEEAFDFSGAVKQIHVHSMSRITDILEVKNLDVVSIEYASSPKNLDFISMNMLEKSDKHVRVGVSRTDIDAIIAELYEMGIYEPQSWQLVEDENKIRKRFEKAKEKFGERMTFAGPDCGLGGWPDQEAAQMLLKNTVAAVKAAQSFS